MMKIGKNLVDISKPADVLAALRMVRIQIVTGGKAETMRFGEDEVTFSRSNIKHLDEEIARYERLVSQSSGGGRRRYAKGFTY